MQPALFIDLTSASVTSQRPSMAGKTEVIVPIPNGTPFMQAFEAIRALASVIGNTPIQLNVVLTIMIGDLR